MGRTDVLHTRDDELLVTIGRSTQGLRTLLMHPAGGGLDPYLGVVLPLRRLGPVHGIRAAGLVPGERPDDSLPDMLRRYLALVDRLDAPHCAGERNEAHLARWRELAPNLRARPIPGGHFEALAPAQLPGVLAEVTGFLRDTEPVPTGGRGESVPTVRPEPAYHEEKES